MNRLFLAAIVFTVTAPGIALPDDAAAPTYEKQIAPFFKTYCVGCHDGDDDSKGGLNLVSFKTLMEGGDAGEVIVEGKSDQSRLVQMLLGTARPKMPPKDSKQPTAAEIEMVKRWVDLGAKGPAVSSPQSADDLVVRHIEPKVSVAAAISAVAFSRDGHWLAAARHRDVLLFDAATGRIVQTLSGAENPINTVAFSPDSHSVAAAEGMPSIAGHVRVWQVGASESRVFTGHADSIYSLAYSPTENKLVTASYDKSLIVWDTQSGREIHALKHHTGAVFAVAFSSDGKTLVSAAADQTVKLWSVDAGQRILTLTEATKGLNSVAFHPRRNEFASVGIDKMIRIYDWNGTTAKLKRSSFAHDAPILSLVYNPDGTTLFTGSEDLRIKAWDSATLQERHVYENLPDWPQTLAVSSDGTQLAAGLSNGDLTLYDAGSAKKLRDFVKAGKPQVASARIQDPGSEIPNSVYPSRFALPYFVAVAAMLGQQSAADDANQPKPNPPMPRLDTVSPRAVVRGNKIKFTFSGQNIHDADRLFVSHGRLAATLLPGDAKSPNQSSCEIEIPADMPTGMVALRLHTPLGSTAARSFYVGPFAEVAEKEDNSKRETATPAGLPATLVGTIASKGDQDLWMCDAQPGQELVFVLVGPGLGSSLAARLTLLDGAGRPLAVATRHSWNSEVVVSHKFDAAQKCFLLVEDRDYTGGGNHYYYIHAGTFPYVTSVYPLGIKTADDGLPGGDQVQSVDVVGTNVPAHTRIAPVPGRGARFHTLDTPAGKTLNTARFESSPYPEYAELEPNDNPAQARLLPVPSAISGKIAPATAHRADVDLVAFDAKKGDRLTIETLARRLGSALDSFLEILDASGKSVPRYTLRAVAETYVVLRDHDSRSKGVRLQNWEDFQANDLVMLGGEVIKVQLLPLGPDEDVKFFDKAGLRLGYLGTTPEAHAINSFAYKVEVHPPGVKFPPNGMPVVDLDYESDDGGPGLGSDSQILFDVPADGRYIVRVRDVRDLEGDDCFYRLVIRPRQEDFRISLDPENPNVPRGGSLPVTVNLDRLDGFNGPVDIRIEGLPAGITATSTRIGPDLFSAMLPFTSNASPGEPVVGNDSKDPPGSAPIIFKAIASARIGDQLIERATTPGFGLHQVTVTSPPDIGVNVEPLAATIAPGQELKFTVTIERRNAFSGRVPVEVLNLPHGLRVLDVGLNGVLINETETSRSFVVACDPWAEPGPLLFYAAPKVESKNERHASSPIRLEVRPAADVAGIQK
jgi:WD40 repeat protein